MELIEMGGNNENKRVIAAKNIRFGLRARFPGVKFQVRSHRSHTQPMICIFWTDGPAMEEVDPVLHKYQADQLLYAQRQDMQGCIIEVGYRERRHG